MPEGEQLGELVDVLADQLDELHHGPDDRSALDAIGVPWWFMVG